MINLSLSEKKMLRDYIGQIRKKFSNKILAIIFYGSKASGDSHKDSDIDMLIVVDGHENKIKRQIQDICWDVMLEHDFPSLMTPIIFFRKQYEQYKSWNSSFLNNVAKEGISL